MKTRIAALVILCGLFLSASVFAGEPVPASKAVAQSVAKNVQKKLNYPQFAIDKKLECCVMVSIVINDDGSLKVDAANSVDKNLKNYVVKQIEKISSADYTRYAGQTILVRVKFNLLEV